MPHFAILGAGITGVTTAYSMLKRGYDVTVFDRHPYPAMETSFANGGQLSSSNAEVWNHWSTVLKGLKWMFRRDAPLLLNPAPSWSKYSWLAEFVAAMPRYRSNTLETARLAIRARDLMFEIAEQEGIEFDLERRGILHLYRDKKTFDHAGEVSKLLRSVGLERHPVDRSEILSIEPTINGELYGGYFTPSDCTGDIHKFTRGLAETTIAKGARYQFNAAIDAVSLRGGSVAVRWRDAQADVGAAQNESVFDGVVICAGVGSRRFARMLGDRVNIYPVKGYSITVHLDDDVSRNAAPWVSLLDDDAKIVTSRLGENRFRVAGTAEFNGRNYDIRADRIAPLLNWTRKLFPGVGTSRVVPWAGLRPMMPDMLPRVGAGKMPNVFYNTGHGHLGWTLSCATAELVAESIAARH